LEDVRDVLDELDGPGVDAGVDGRSSGEVKGGGVTETDRCMVAMWMDGRARQKDVAAAEGCGIAMVNALALAAGTASTPSPSGCSFPFAASLARFLSRSRSFFSRFLCLRISSSSVRSSGVYGPTPFKRLVNTSR